MIKEKLSGNVIYLDESSLIIKMKNLQELVNNNYEDYIFKLLYITVYRNYL